MRPLVSVLLCGALAAPAQDMAIAPVPSDKNIIVRPYVAREVPPVRLDNSARLAQLIRAEIWSALTSLKREGMAQIVIDKNVGALLGFADRHYVIEKGRVVWNGTSSALQENSNVVHQYLGV